MNYIALFLAIYLATNAIRADQFNKTTSVKTYSNDTEYEKRVNLYLTNAARLMQNIYNQKRDIFLSFTKGTSHDNKNNKNITADYRRLVYQLAANLSVIPVKFLSNRTLQRQVQRLSKLQIYGLNEKDFEKANSHLQTMRSFMTMPFVCPYKYSSNPECGGHQGHSMIHYILKHSRLSKSFVELKYYWKKWRDDLHSSKSTFIDFIRFLRLAASYNGHVTPSRTWYLYYETDNFQRELEDVISEIMPLYRELHAYLRHSLMQTYGNHLSESDGSIPASVYEQMINQAWLQKTAFRLPYPKVNLPHVQQRLLEVLVTPKKLNERAAKSFEVLGLNHMSNAFFDKFARRITEEEGGVDCKAELFYFPPDVGIRYCPELDFKKLMQMHGHMAEVQYNLYKSKLPFGLDREPCPGFSSAIGEACVIASGTPRHLHRMHILYNSSLTTEQSLNRLFRMGVHTLLALTQYFVNDKFIVDVMDGRIAAQEYNCAYWRLQNQYAGVKSPLKRTEKNFDPDYKFYRGLNPENSNTMKFVSEILGYQIYRKLCLVSGQYIPGTPDYPLNNCDFFGSEKENDNGTKKAGDILRQMMELGATKHWRDVMAIGTGSHKLSGEAVMEYFAPLYTWLKDENKRLELEIGWDDDINCSSGD